MVLRIDQTKDLHSWITRKYVSYFKSAPRDWIVDGFFLNNRPITVTTLYGQNQPIAVLGREPLERINWRRDRSFENIRSISFAIASDVW
jgi:hypothetical protein